MREIIENFRLENIITKLSKNDLLYYNTAPEAPAGHSELEPLNLNEEEMARIIAFLKTLDSPVDADPQWLTALR